ncbi:hypothetical protein CCP4SC76_530001 [Gammaproteobacteria bacterium]
MVQMIQRAAYHAMLKYDDYLVCLYLVGKATKGELKNYDRTFERPGIEGLDILIQQRWALLPVGLAAIEATDLINQRQAMFSNLRGILALAQNDDKKAFQFFEEICKIRSTFGIAVLNRAFVLVHQDRYQDAIDLLRPLTKSGDINDPALLSGAYTTWGVAAWGLKHFDEAANQFGKASEVNPKSVMSYFYWSEMLISSTKRQKRPPSAGFSSNGQNYSRPMPNRPSTTSG